MKKFKVGDKVLFGNQVVEITQIFDSGKCMVSNGWLQNSAWIDDLELYKTPQERLFDLGFEKVAKHKYVKHHKGGSGYDTPYKITIEFAFNSYQVKCECENWVGVDLELAEILLDYLEDIIK